MPNIELDFKNFATEFIVEIHLFNPSTNIQFSIAQATNVQLDVYNLLGQKVQALNSRKLNAGLHNYTFNASSLSSGVYLYRIHAGSSVQTKRMLLIK